MLSTRHHRCKQCTYCQLYTDWYVSCTHTKTITNKWISTTVSEHTSKCWTIRNTGVQSFIRALIWCWGELPSSSCSWHCAGGWRVGGCKWSNAGKRPVCPESTSQPECAAWSLLKAARWGRWTCSSGRKRCTFAAKRLHLLKGDVPDTIYVKKIMFTLNISVDFTGSVSNFSGVTGTLVCNFRKLQLPFERGGLGLPKLSLYHCAFSLRHLG